MRRHEGLQSLSRDHHHALVAAKHLAAAGESADAAASAGRLLQEWRDLERHFREEEEVLLPVLARYAGSDCPEIGETLRQHVEIRGVVDQVQERIECGLDPDGPLLRRLGSLLREHVRFEERTLFPEVEQVVPVEQLWRLQRRFRDRRWSRPSRGARLFAGHPESVHERRRSQRRYP